VGVFDMATQSDCAIHLFISLPRLRDLIDTGVITRQPPTIQTRFVANVSRIFVHEPQREMVTKRLHMNACFIREQDVNWLR
jgi:hypothetical protein